MTRTLVRRWPTMSMLLIVWLVLLTTTARAATPLTVQFNVSESGHTEAVTLTITADVPLATTITLDLDPTLTVTASASDCRRDGTQWQCRTSDSPWIGVFAVAFDLATPAGTVATAHVTAPNASATAQITAVGIPAATATATTTATSQPPVATETIGPTATPWLTPTPMLPSAEPLPDSAEPNNETGRATPLGVPSTLDKLSFWPLGDVDYFAVQVKPSQAGLTLTVNTYLTVGLDTQLRLLTSDGTEIASNDDVGPTDPRSSIAVRAAAGTYLLEVRNVAPTHPAFKTYRLEVALVAAPTAAPIPTTEAAPAAAPWDSYHGNYGWETAALIPIGDTVEGLTFGCPDYAYLDLASCTVPDFFTISVKGGLCYSASTTVAAGVDTNLIVYGPERDMAAPWAGNDDAAPDEAGSTVLFCVPESAGVLDAYLLIGQVGRLAPPLHERTYTLRVDRWLPTTATPTATTIPMGTGGTAGGIAPTNGGDGMGGSNPQPQPAAPQPTLSERDTPLAGIQIEEIPIAQAAQPTAQPTILVPLSVVVCYDGVHANKSCDIDEGVAGVTVYVTDEQSGTILAQAVTDPSGRAAMSVRVRDTAMLIVSMPSFDATQRVSARMPQVKPIMVSTVTPLPALLP
ncbi:pre-peptidase C-terminal domain-containing protein [Herpetosiphon gulosus]|uniref:Peptidase C-terminal archaeal/bacterial domain-containing protein n=1 Tax=Herpetosiphon gulosus TaxID=1973496 RepID=A0ABP9X722_9CHLR